MHKSEVGMQDATAETHGKTRIQARKHCEGLAAISKLPAKRLRQGPDGEARGLAHTHTHAFS